ncbi:gamma-taxilin-like isoform X2 [Periplaneta americana]|uniref:gamma-taxilin-like isoform X2 n=1 Tax=Periplaneta americana TaxID=6978 RepID=UPI0037E92D8B
MRTGVIIRTKYTVRGKAFLSLVQCKSVCLGCLATKKRTYSAFNLKRNPGTSRRAVGVLSSGNTQLRCAVIELLCGPACILLPKSDDTNMDNKSSDVTVKVESSATIENKEIEKVKQTSEPTVKKSNKEEKSRKKDDKSVEQVLKALNSLETTEEKLAAMCKKYADIVDENRKLQLNAKQTEKRLSMIQREKEQLQTEHSKAVLTRSRLESLCRELQRQNKAIKDESLLKIREEEEKRKEVSAKFQSTLNEITALMQQNNEKNSKLREDNLEMTKKFKTVCEQYELREQQVEKITKQMQLEAQLADAKLAKAKMEMAAEKEALLKEKQQLLMDLTEYQAKCQELQTTEVNLRSQISLYTDKYDEFQNALSRSNEVFGGFKGEMEKMSKKICKLEKETSSWKQRWEKSHQALLEMAADKQQRDSELALATRQLAQLQKLCRTLQAERTSLLAQLKTEETNKVGETASSGDIALNSLQQPQHLKTTQSTSTKNVEVCQHETEKTTQQDSNVLYSQTEELKNSTNLEVMKENEMLLPSTENILPEMVLNDNAQVRNISSTTFLNGEKTAEVNFSPVVEVCYDKEIKYESSSEQNSVIITSKSITDNSPLLLNIPQESIAKQEESTENNISNISECSESTRPKASQIQNQGSNFVMNRSPTQEQKSLTTTSSDTTQMKGEAEIKPATPNEYITSGDVQPNNEIFSSDVVVNGELQLLSNDTSTEAVDKKLHQEISEIVPVLSVNVVNGVAEQMPVKGAASETKKGKEGAKKRKNK